MQVCPKWDSLPTWAACPKVEDYIYTSGYLWPSDTVKSPVFFKPGLLMYLFHYMLESISSKVHINSDKSWHLIFKFRSVMVQGDVSTCGKMKVSLTRQMHLSKSVQTLTIFVPLMIQNFSNVYNMSHIHIPRHQYGLNYPSLMAFTPPKNLHTLWSCKSRTPYTTHLCLAVIGQFEIPMLPFLNFFSVISCTFLAGITTQIN
jgi:hypothetical protein